MFLNKNLVLTGHDTFQCRSLWLKKGYDFIKNNRSFKDNDAVVYLGVGKNMVSSIRFWMRSFDIIDEDDKLTEFGILLLDDTGFDPYLEDEGSLWLLHFKLVIKNYSSIYNLLFNEFRKEKIEFTKESFVKYIKDNTILDDFAVMTKMYLRSDSQNKDKEDNYSGLLTELNLLKNIGEKNDELFVIENSDKENIPYDILLYCILEAGGFESSINLNKIESDFNNIGSIFGINRNGIINHINVITKHYKNIVYSDYAGIKELQIKKKINPITVLEKYYGKKD